MTCDLQMASFLPCEWSIVLKARRQDTRRAVEALAALCAPYRQPLYAHLRLRGHSPDEARALTGQFFTRLLQNKTLAYMKRDCGKLRSFLLTALNRFLTEQASENPTVAPETDAIEKVFEHNWALALLNVVYNRLETEYKEAGREEIFAVLKFSLAGRTQALGWDELAAALMLSPADVKNHVQALRKRYAEVLRQEIGRLVATPADVEEELRCLFPGALAG